MPRMLGVVVVVATVVGAAVGDEAHGCGSGPLLYEDTMAAADAVWGRGMLENDPPRTFGPNGVTFTIEAKEWVTLINQASLYEDVEICVSTASKIPQEGEAWASLAFWGTDTKNVYSFTVFPANGTFAVYRMQRGKLLTPMPWTKHEAIKRTPGAINELSAVLNGNVATLSINGVKVSDFNGFPPKGGSMVGIDFGSNEQLSSPATVSFTKFQVRELMPQARPPK